jgi:putrescine transport system substrate-binding protein
MARGPVRRALWLVAALGLAACGRHAGPAASSAPGAAPGGAGGRGDAEAVLNIYNWADYIAPDIVPNFEKEYGIKVHYDMFDANTVLQTKLLTGKTGYDIVVPSASFMAPQIRAGVFQKLDRAQLPNIRNIDSELARRMEPLDPGMAHGVNYFWGTSGIGYNVDKIRAAMPDAPVDSLAMVYDPAVVSHFKKCGVIIVDEPAEVVSTVLIYLGRDAHSERPEDLAAAEKVLLAIRPNVRYIQAEQYMEDLANGEICLALGWSGDVLGAAMRAREAKRGVVIKYNIPREGALLFFDMMAIPADAPHPRNAHLFINYMLRPEVAARNSSFVHYASANAAAYPLIDPQVRDDPSVFPPPATMQRLVPDLPHSAAYMRALTRTWTRFRTGH